MCETTNTFDKVSKIIEIPAVLGDASMSDLQWDATSLAEYRIDYSVPFRFPLLSSYSS